MRNLLSLLLLFGITPAYAAEGMAINPDPALILTQAVPFAVLIIVLQKLVFGPFAAYLADRDTATVGAREEAIALQQRAEDKLSDYEARLAEARVECQGIRNQTRADALAAREGKIAEARGESLRQREAALRTIAAEKDAASKELGRLSQSLGSEIAERVLGHAAVH